ncbi:MAG: hypothetical protein H6937_05990 [Burkholderiales bacterium]|nr:hypothetical protein [Burkholderiales bacterium]MDR4517441.1 hypothetical protein [Nitrosomonas sp.]
MKNRIFSETTESIHDHLGREAVIKPHEENHLFNMLVIAPIWTVFFVLI